MAQFVALRSIIVRKPTMRRFFRYRLRTLLAFVLLVAVGLGVYRHFREQQRRQQEFMIEAIPLGAKFTIKRWRSDRERECSDPTELRMMDDIVAVDLFGRGWYPFKDGRPDESIGGAPHIQLLSALRKKRRSDDVDTIHAMVRRLGDLPGLRRLSLQGSSITDDDVAALGQLTRLEYLNLRWSRVTIAALPHIGRLTELKHLSLGSTEMSDFGLKYLVGLRKLEALDLEYTDIFDEGLSHLRQFPNLTHLYLGGTQVRYVNLSGMPNLQSVDLGYTPTVGLYLDGSRQVRSLDLGATGIKGDQLERLRTLPLLKQLSLHNTALTGEGLVVLQQLPALEAICVDLAALDSCGLRHVKEHPVLTEVHVNVELNRSGRGEWQYTPEDYEKLNAIERDLSPRVVLHSHWPAPPP